MSLPGPDAAGPRLPVENVQDYPRPPALETVPQRVRAVAGGGVVCDSLSALRVLETHHAPTYYIPLHDIAPGVLRPEGRGGSFCEWKGRAAYFTLVAGDQRRPGAAWHYPSPSSRFAALKGHVAFYPGLLDAAWVGDQPVSPQPGDFYGGWVTPNLTGTVKGDAATRFW